MGNQPTVETACQMMARSIQFLKREIEAKKRRRRQLEGTLQKLLSQPNPDPALVQDLKRHIQELETELESDRTDLSAFENEYAASCGP
ncbi:MAG TPA: hypothetical protein VH575_06680 [Gemmataceae bacterium]